MTAVDRCRDWLQRGVGSAVCAVALLAAITSGSKFWMYNLTLIAVYGLVVVGLNVVAGYAGQVSFAQTAFMAMGGYGVGILATNHGWNPWAALVLAAVLAAIVAMVIGTPLFKLRGHYFTMATFALAIGVDSYVTGATQLTGGAVGISAIPPLRIGGLSSYQPVPMLLLASACCAAAMLLVVRFRTSHVGRAWKTVASREDVAASLGLRVRRAKLLAFVIAAVFGAVGGGLYAEATGFVSPDLYSVTIVVNLFVMLFIGGRGRTFGPLLGAAVIIVLPEELSSISSLQGIVFDVLLLAIVLVRPQGLLGRAGDGRGNRARWIPRRLGRRLGGLPTRETPFAAASAERTPLPRALPVERPPTHALLGEGRIVSSARDGTPRELRVAGVTKRFGGVMALSDVTVELSEGRITGLIGPNGAGKSTLLSILAGATPPTSGSVHFGDVELTGRGREPAARAGIVQTFQQASPISGLTALDNVLVGMTARYGGSAALLGGVMPGQRRHQAGLRDHGERVLEAFGLADCAQSDAASLSFGQLRLLEIARAYATEPRILLLDEPAAGLNQTEVTQLREVILELRSAGIGVFVVDHDVPFLFGLCDEIVAMEFGKVIGKGAPEAIQNDERVRAAYLTVDNGSGSAPSAEASPGDEGEPDGKANSGSAGLVERL